jgi:hypothetical protein
MSNNFELTDEHRNLFPKYVADYVAKCYRTLDPDTVFDGEFAIHATRELYRVAGLDQPKYFFIGTWPECVAESRRLQTLAEQVTNPSAKPVRDVSGALSWGQFSAAAAAFARFFVDEMGVEALTEKARVISDVTEASGPTLLWIEAAFISYPPTDISPDPANPDQPKCTWGKLQGASGWVVGNVDDLIAEDRARILAEAKKR